MTFFVPDFHVLGVGYNALNKSREDLHQIYHELGFQPLLDSFLTLQDSAKLRNASPNGDQLDHFAETILQAIQEKCHAGDFLFLDFPFSIKFAGFSKVVSYAASLGVKIIFFLHDLDGVRFQNPLLNWVDSSCLDLAYCLISATDEMDDCLINSLKVSPAVRRVHYEYWDYLTPDVVNERQNALLCFAGNLAKSTFIRQIPQELVDQGVNLYGKGMREDYRGRFCGQYDPLTLVARLDGRFGLVWDGKSAFTCSGNFGRYLRINTSHKFGLYLATGKPVLCWRESALAKIVLEHGVGLAVSSLREILPTLSRLPLSAYQEMRQNVLEMRKKVISGDHLKSVILDSMK